jgi:heat shock protein HslJ
MRTFTSIALAIGMTAILAACGSSNSSALTGKNWQLTSITEKVPAFQGVIPAADQSRYVITFNTDGTFNGTADCNQIAGTYTTSGSNGLTIIPGISTMAFCPEDSFAGLFVHGLGRAKTYEIASDQLTITLDDEGTMTFVVGVAAGPSEVASAAPSGAAASASVAASATPKPTAKPTPKPTAKPTAAPSKAPGASATPKPTPAPSTGLTGKAWMLTAITEKTPAFQGVVPADQQANYTIEFLADGTFTAKADCNTLAGTYDTADPKAATGDLAIVPGATTTAACAEDSLSDLYMLGLGNAASYAIASGQLTITLADEGTLVYK